MDQTISSIQEINQMTVSTIHTINPMPISSFNTINTMTVSSFNTINLGGVPYSFNPFNLADIQTMNLLLLSSITTYDLSGNSTYYDIDISGVVNLSTLRSIETLQEISTIEGNAALQTVSGPIELSLHEIINSHNTLLEIENLNKTNFNSLDFGQFRSTLYKWAAQGYPDSFLAYSFPVMTPSINGSLYNCSDGNPKNIWDYIPFCLNLSLQDWLTTYQQKVDGIKLSFSVNENPYVVNIHVIRI